jgi:hypothetical protein
MTARDNATNEFHRFYNDLKKIKDNSLNGFEEFITVKFSCLNSNWVCIKFRIHPNVHAHVMTIMNVSV